MQTRCRHLGGTGRIGDIARIAGVQSVHVSDGDIVIEHTRPISQVRALAAEYNVGIEPIAEPEVRYIRTTAANIDQLCELSGGEMVDITSDVLYLAKQMSEAKKYLPGFETHAHYMSEANRMLDLITPEAT